MPVVVVEPEPGVSSVVVVAADVVVEPSTSTEVEVVVPAPATVVTVRPSSAKEPWESDQRSARLHPDNAGASPARTSHRPVESRKVLRSICRMAAV